MEIFLLVLVVIVIIIAIIIENDKATEFLKILGVILTIFLATMVGILIQPPKGSHYKVKELEKNTVFMIKDSVGGFKPGDTVWINYKKMMIDPLDSVAMQAVIVEEIKKK